jgi:hypothetical protein
VSSRTEVLIFHRSSKDYVPAVLIDGVSKEEIETAEKLWRPEIQKAVKHMESKNIPEDQRPQHGHWDWKKKHDAVNNLLAYQILGVECESTMQGLILIQTAGVFSRIPTQKGNGLVYVMFVEVAPWNSSLIMPEPRYNQVGTVLLASAIDISIDLGFKGRIGLHALPQAEKWYAERCNMTDLGPDQDPQHQNLRYFEMTPEQATVFRTT